MPLPVDEPPGVDVPIPLPPGCPVPVVGELIGAAVVLFDDGVVEFGVLGPQASALAAQMMLVNMKLNRMVFRLLGV